MCMTSVHLDADDRVNHFATPTETQDLSQFSLLLMLFSNPGLIGSLS